MRKAIDAIMKVKSNMDSGMFSGERNSTALNSDKSWFDSMNRIYKNAAFTWQRRISEKLGL
jgi:hypothetical protein